MCFWNIGSTTPSYPCLFCTIHAIFYRLKKSIPLLKLPLFPRILITKMMEPEEVYRLSLCSHRMYSILTSSKLEIDAFHVRFSSRYIRVCITKSGKNSLIYFTYYKEFMDISQVIFRFLNLRAMFFFNLSFLPNDVFEIYNRIISLYSCPHIRWVFDLDQLWLEDLHEYLDIALAGKCHRLSFYNGTISRELLTELMDKTPVTTKLEITSNMPVEFQHPNAFKYKTIDYSEARWATLDDLKSVRNEWIVDLKSTNFDCHDINEFLKYWVNCDEAMLTRLTLQLKEDTVIDDIVLLDKLTVLLYYYKDLPHFVIKVKKITNEKLVVGHFEPKEDNRINFSVWSANEFPGVFDLLEMLEKIKELENELLRMEESEEVIDWREQNKRRREIPLEVEKLRRLMEEKDDFGFIYVS
ncbi:hypothetical protein CRE_24901 [Caenorhabditis remanei]|uniref:Sdz-33 F-box domain-containing protein n=2 Tax=Caenorhabditis remanei TaxID=31234 RepID=E3MHY5_CAERE|nr:hypothetical protein CRE_24901 [Caenorhabditis remanei]